MFFLFRTFAADMEKESKRKKKTTAAGDGGGKKEHKPNWREVYASVEDIQQFLSDNIYLRHNVITKRVECRLLKRDPWDDYDGGTESALQLLAAMGSTRSDPQPPNLWGLWQPITDRIVNSLWVRLSKEKPVRIQDIYHVLESDFVPEFHPFRHYLEHLPPWNGENHILAMSTTVMVKGGVDEQMRFADYLTKWLVAMVAGWIDEREVNHVILIFIGEQGIYKTTWFNYILPPELRSYFYTKTNASRMTKDDLLVLAQYGLVCYEELDTMSSRELNQLKSAVTMPSIDERAAYAHFHEHRKHIASFCGTGNNVQFLSDTTGTRRWLPCEVESIMSPRDNPFDYEGIYSQAYALYQEGFQYWFSPEEIREQSKHNSQFETPKDELELVDYFFRQPLGADTGEFLPTAIAKKIVSSPGTNVSTVALGRAFKRLGFRDGMENRCRGFYVVRRTDEERQTRARSLAYEAAKNETQITDDTDIF